MSKRSSLRLLPTAITIGMASINAQAGGLMLYEIGTDNTGLANAGAAARAQGPSTIASNIAGMSYLEGTQISAGAQVIFGDLSVNENSNTTNSGSNSGNAMNPLPAAAFFITHAVDENWSVGFGSYGDFGLAYEYDKDWSGRYFAQEGTILGMSMVPSVAYRFNDQWSVGLGLRAMYGFLETKMGFDNRPFDPAASDGQIKYKDEDWGYGGNAGVIYQPQEGTRIGLAYTSKVDLNFGDGLEFDGLHPAGEALLQTTGIQGAYTKIDLQVPQTATLSLYQKLDERWALLASTNWQDWSEFGEIAVNLDANAISANKNLNAHYKDTWHLSLGTQYQATDKWLWNAGVAYDSSAVSDGNRTWSNPMAEQYRIATGATYALDENTDLNLSYALILMGDIEVDQTKQLNANDRVAGSFDNAWLSAINGSMTWRF